MIELSERTRRVSATRVLEILRKYDAKSLVDPFMGIPTHLNYLKHQGLAVHGGDVVEWFVRVGEGLVVNDFTILKDNEVAEIVEMIPGRIYAADMFKAWEGVFFSEEQCQYLGVWHDNVRSLRSDGQTGLAILGLWHVLCYWLQKSHYPDDMQDIPPSELAWNYIRQTEQWVAPNLLHNTVRQSDVLVTIGRQTADALFLAPPARNTFRAADARIWMWEAWWQGNPYFNIEHYYRDSLFGARSADEQGYARAIAGVLSSAADYRVVVVQTTEQKRSAFEALLRNARKNVEIIAPHPYETYLIGTN
ncbi:MAG: hypothetical protein M3126_03970 [Candidatus Eremiobacteraeota bacterium]|nr:hypothetical protein [Candidatus Eremiobacteraeota bacterium]